ncbi:MAG: hypothetical protein ACOY5F_22030 [Pseudomonadota bacterium]
MYLNPLVADLMASGIANRIAFLKDHRVELSADILAALARLESELDQFANAVWASIDLLEGRSPGTGSTPPYFGQCNTRNGDVLPGRIARL